MILDLRRRKVADEGLPWIKRNAVATLADPDRFARTSHWGSILQTPVVGSGEFVNSPILRNVPPFKELFRWRSLPAIASRSLHDRFATANGHFTPARTIGGSQVVGKRVAYFSGCMTDRLFPEMGEAVVRVVRALGCDVYFPPAQSCCGLPAINAGDGSAAQTMMLQTLDALEKVQADVILSGSTSCVVSILQDYPRLLAGDPENLARAKRLADRVVDFTTFVVRDARPRDVSLRDGIERIVTVHDSCQSHNCLGLRREPRWVLETLLGYTIMEMNESSICCGFGGSFSFEHPRVAERIARRKLKHIDETSAPVVVTDNPGCIMHLRGAVNAAKHGPKVMHLAEVIDEALARRDHEPSGR
jgi:Fe-S oxidoreductase